MTVTLDMFYVTLLVQGTGCVFLVLLFAALYWHYPRRYFLHWTLAWGCFALYLLAGAAAFRLRMETAPSMEAIGLIRQLSNLGNWLRGPLLLMGALEYLGLRRAKRTDYFILAALGVVAVAGAGISGGRTPGLVSELLRIQLPNGVTGVALGIFGYAFLLEWRRERSAGAALLATSSFLFGAQQLFYAVASALVEWQTPIRVIAHYLSLFDTLLEVGIGVGMVFTLLDDERRRSSTLQRRQIEMYQREAEMAAELKRIQRSAAQLASAKPLHAKLEEIVRVTAEACGAPMIAILLFDERARQMRLGASIDLPEEWKRALDSSPIDRLWSSCAEKPVSGQEVVIVEDLREDPRWQSHRNIIDAARLRSLWSIPVVGGKSRLLAALVMYHEEPNRPTEAQVELAQAYAYHAAVAIENAQLYEETERRLVRMEGLYEIARALGGIQGSRAAIGRLAERIAHLLNATKCLVSTHDSRNGGIRPHLPGHNVNEELVKAVIAHLDEDSLRALWDPRSREPLIINDLSFLPANIQSLARRLGIANLMAVDMLAKEEVIGVVHLANKAGGFTPEDANLVNIFASQAATVIQAESRLDRIYEVATRYQGQELFDRAALTLAELLEMSHVFIGQIEGAPHRARALAFCEESAIKRIWGYDLSGTASEAVMERLHLISCDQGVKQVFPDDRQAKNWEVESYIGSPILNSRGEIIGIINAYDRHPKDFSSADSRILQIIGQRVGAELERQHGEEERRALELQLLQSQKMEAIGTLAGGIAHDFNNLLAGITGYASLIKMQINADDPIFHAVTTIEQSANRAAALTQQLLGFARGGKYKVEVVNLNEVVERVRSLISRTFDRAIEIKAKTGENLWLVEADAGQIEQSLLNLAVNARDAMPEGGELRIETDNLTVGDDYARRHLNLLPGRYVRLTVSDTGTGMDTVTQSRIFEPFFTTKEKGKGTGMGLAMVYGIVRNHGGHIDLQSEVGVGSSFRMFFPITEKRLGSETPEVESPIPTGVETILVVDDEEVVRSLADEVLSGFGYTVLTARNGREALEIYLQQRDRISLVILDMIMPELGGEATFKRLKEINPSVKVLLSSGYSATSQVQSMLQSGVKGFVPKPYQVRDLAEAIRRTLDESLAPSA
ncbi:MAG: GAF domain-containing protein [Acidobacteria bacterium]|nr:GAF domain-containing protein [Acidobacteriota bacterium]